jgi:hypothetical protein
MTFKTASDLQSYQQRVGSHATKEHPTGRIDAVPEWAVAPEEYYNTIKEQYALLQGTLYEICEEEKWCNIQLRSSLPFEEADRLRKQKFNLGQLHLEIQTNLHELRPILTEAGNQSWATTWRLLARNELDEAIFNRIEDMCREMLGRHRKQDSNEMELPPGFAAKKNRAAHLRQKIRDKRDGTASKKRREQRERQQQRKNNL